MTRAKAWMPLLHFDIPVGGRWPVPQLPAGKRRGYPCKEAADWNRRNLKLAGQVSRSGSVHSAIAGAATAGMDGARPGATATPSGHVRP